MRRSLGSLGLGQRIKKRRGERRRRRKRTVEKDEGRESLLLHSLLLPPAAAAAAAAVTERELVPLGALFLPLFPSFLPSPLSGTCEERKAKAESPSSCYTHILDPCPEREREREEGAEMRRRMASPPLLPFPSLPISLLFLFPFFFLPSVSSPFDVENFSLLSFFSFSFANDLLSSSSLPQLRLPHQDRFSSFSLPLLLSSSLATLPTF